MGYAYCCNETPGISCRNYKSSVQDEIRIEPASGKFIPDAFPFIVIQT